MRHNANGDPAGLFVVKINGGQLRQLLPASVDLNGLAQVTFDGNDDDPAWGTHPLVH